MATPSKNWRKQVTVNPAAGITFAKSNPETLPAAYLTIKNVSEGPIVYKVKTTNPDNYLVRPNQGVIMPQQDISVRV